jgi:NAD(P)-dependent dehydrogenase (short-subunit alcohol dehydrogenase family)
MKSLKGKTAVVTGGGGTGIGNALVRRLAEAGANVAYCDIKGLDKTKADISKYEVKKYSEHVDVGDKASVYRFAENVLAEFGHIDILINNAGIATGDIEFVDVSDDDLEKITNVNYWGVIRMTKAFYKHLLGRPEAAIVNISSTQGILAAPHLVPYCATKFAVRGFTDALRVENQIAENKNLTIHTVHPGAVATDITINADHHGPRTELFHQELQKGISPDQAAKEILKGMMKGTARIFISKGRAHDIIARLIPSHVHIPIRWILKLRGIGKP